MTKKPDQLVIEIGVETIDRYSRVYHLKYLLANTETEPIDRACDLAEETNLTNLGQAIAHLVRIQYGIDFVIFRYYEMLVEKGRLFAPDVLGSTLLTKNAEAPCNVVWSVPAAGAVGKLVEFVIPMT